MGLFAKLRRWYEGEQKIHEFDDDPNSGVFIVPMVYTEHHWSAKAVRAIVAFYLQHWKWIWSTVIGVASIVAVL